MKSDFPFNMCDLMSLTLKSSTFHTVSWVCFPLNFTRFCLSTEHARHFFSSFSSNLQWFQLLSHGGAVNLYNPNYKSPAWAHIPKWHWLQFPISIWIFTKMGRKCGTRNTKRMLIHSFTQFINCFHITYHCISWNSKWIHRTLVVKVQYAKKN